MPMGQGLMAVLLQLLVDPLFPLSPPACGKPSHPTGWGLWLCDWIRQLQALLLLSLCLPTDFWTLT